VGLQKLLDNAVYCTHQGTKLGVTHPPSTHVCPAAYAAAADVLAARPRRRAGIQLWQGLRHLASLRELRLEHQNGAGMPANALACTGLRGLTLLSSSANDWPLALQQLSERLPTIPAMPAVPIAC
jgi:hypothetical protein